jgi:hypothetical protein
VSRTADSILRTFLSGSQFIGNYNQFSVLGKKKVLVPNMVTTDMKGNETHICQLDISPKAEILSLTSLLCLQAKSRVTDSSFPPPMVILPSLHVLRAKHPKETVGCNMTG